MKTLLLLPLALALGGCSSFTTTQQDLSYGPDAKPLRQITTRATTRTFFDSKSSLANFRATQTDKNQSAFVGSLAQESSGSNTVNLVQAITEAAIRATLKP